jgi:hypothetical protein
VGLASVGLGVPVRIRVFGCPPSTFLLDGLNLII